MTVPAVIEHWHRIVNERDLGGLSALLADDVVFLSPVVHTAQQGRALTTAYLTAAMQVLNNDSFRYVGAWYGTRSAVLEFVTELDGIQINGVDIIEWNDDQRINRFKVMVRPLKAINLLHQRMGEMLARHAGAQGPAAGRPQ